MLLAGATVHNHAFAQLQTGTSADGWRALFDGKSLDAWRGWGSRGIPPGWHIVGETLAKEGEVDDLITREQFGNFELELEWKIGKGGNSGIFYRGTREYDHIYWSGPEYQLLDDAYARDGRSRLTSAAAAYGVYASPAGVVKPFGEWNRTRIVVNGAHVEHWLNGVKVVEYELGAPIGKHASRRASSRSTRVTALRHGVTSAFRAITTALLPCATFASVSCHDRHASRLDDVSAVLHLGRVVRDDGHVSWADAALY
jgi:hypothetical protein